MPLNCYSETHISDKSFSEEKLNIKFEANIFDNQLSNNNNMNIIESRIINNSLTASSNEKEKEKKKGTKKQNKEEDQRPKRKYVKSKDVKVEDQKYSCKFCGKIYMSYPAFYTHKRNRHNIISITNRNNLFKPKESSKFNSIRNEINSIESSEQNYNKSGNNSSFNGYKYNYYSIGYGKFIGFEFSEYLIKMMKTILEKIYKSENSLFYNSQANVESHIYLEYLEKYKIIFSNKIFIPPAGLKLSIDEILIVYFILFSKVTNEEKLVQTAATFIIYFREYLNIHGWDFYRHFIKFGLFESNNKKSFSQNNFIQFIPDLAEDFILTFIKIPELNLLCENLENLEHLCKNLCNWLFVNELSNMKLVIPDVIDLNKTLP